MFNLWSGIYGSFDEAPVVGPGFAGKQWRDAILDSARAALLPGSRVDFSTLQRNAMLPSLVASMRESRGRARILDFGGGLAAGYIVLRDGLMHRLDNVSYDVLELPEVCETGEQLFDGHAGLRFLRALQEGPGKYDIVYSASALQYVDDWQGFLGSLADFEADYILVSDALVGPIDSFVTLQNYYESRIAAWFVSDSQFVERLAELGYEALIKLPCVPKILGEVGSLPMLNFPIERRIEHAWHFLFRRK